MTTRTCCQVSTNSASQLAKFMAKPPRVKISTPATKRWCSGVFERLYLGSGRADFFQILSGSCRDPQLQSNSQGAPILTASFPKCRSFLPPNLAKFTAEPPRVEISTPATKRWCSGNFERLYLGNGRTDLLQILRGNCRDLLLHSNRQVAPHLDRQRSHMPKSGGEKIDH